MNRKNWIATLAAVIIGAASAGSVLAQPAPGGGFQQGQGRGGQGGFDPTQIRQTMSDRMKEALGATDDEWKVIWPKVEKVQALQQDTSSGMGGMMQMMRRMQGGGGGGGRANGPNLGAIFGANANSDVQIKSADLDKALDNPAASENEIRIKLVAVREAREKAKVALAQSRKELTELLTQRQEAVLFQMGILE